MEEEPKCRGGRRPKRPKGTPHPVADAIIFNTHIRRNIKLAEAPSFGQSVHQYAPLSAGSTDYVALAQEVMKMSTHS